MILILSNRGDLTADLLAFKLNESQYAYIRLNTELFLEASLTWEPERSLSIAAEGQNFDLRDIASVYYRRPQPPTLSPETPEFVRDFAAREARYILRCIDGLVSRRRWINHPSSIAAAENKLLQLRTAARLGFRTARTLLSNNPEELYAFYCKIGSVVCKTLAGGDVILEGVRSAVLTWRLPEGLTVLDFESARQLPVLLQEWIPKSADLRATVIDEMVFVVRIHTQSDERTRIDWRRPELRNLPHEIISVGPSLESKLVHLVHSLGLRFGAIDLVEALEGPPVFLEINPNGQWAWLQQVTGAQIAEAFVAALVKRGKGR